MALNTFLVSKNLARTCTNLISKVGICHKSELPEKKIYHWPYEKYPWNFFTMWYDPFSRKKWDENTKIIQIEGNIGAGKSEFGKTLADELGMLWLPQPDLDSIYINSHGFDYRALNPQLPERLRTCDWKMWHENPTRHSAIHLLHYMYLLRLEQYMNGLAHMFNTGQGIVLERSVYTEKVLIDAMHKLGWLPLGHQRSDGVRFFDWIRRYDYIRANTLTYMLQPCLTIYLDVPPEVCKKNLEQSSDPMIANSKALTLPFLQAIKEEYENNMLSKTEYYGHLIRFDDYHKNDMSTKETVLDVIEDIKTMDFETREKVGDRFETWVTDRIFWHLWNRHRHTTPKVMNVYHLVDQPWYDIAGLGDSVTNGDMLLKRALIQNHVVGLNYHLEDDPAHQSLPKVLFNLKPLRTQIRRALFAEFA